jgi:hypothetical protein
MNLNDAISQLEHQGSAIISLGKGISMAQARWKPSPEDWSILEVLNHLVDEETLDFRRHLHHIFFTPDEAWPSIDPQAWVIAKKYNLRNLDTTLENLESERGRSIRWLAELKAPNWDSSIQMPWGKLSAGDIMASWLAHDLLHLRQLLELRYHLTFSNSLPYMLEYAGKW